MEEELVAKATGENQKTIKSMRYGKPMRFETLLMGALALKAGFSKEMLVKQLDTKPLNQRLKEFSEKTNLTANFNLLLELAELEVENEKSIFIDDEFYENRTLIEKIRVAIKG